MELGNRLEQQRLDQQRNLDLTKQDIGHTVKNLEQHLGRYEELIRQIEKDRNEHYGSLTERLTTTAQETQRLQATTTQLAKMLGNAKVRGQWGEKTADDILRLCGLKEGMHYDKQKTSGQGRPDFTLYLPQDHHLYLDVKFPLDNYIRLVNSDREQERQSYRDAFLRDVKEHMRTLERRDYAASSDQLPDYVVMFIPNEQVHSAIHDWIPGLIDQAIQKRILICGPWNLYASVRVIWQSWESYHQAENVERIIKGLQEFLKVYGRFKDRFGELGSRLDQVTRKYEEVQRSSFNQLDRSLRRIDALRHGQENPSPKIAEESLDDSLATVGEES